MTPHRRQQEFLDLDCEEALFGGAVGGGKTEVLLKWLQEGVQYDHFSGLFLRRTMPQLQGSPTAPIERSSKFFRPLGGQWNGQKKVWMFENHAMVRFGSMQHEMDKHNYDGPEFHRCVFDQVEQFSETQYTYLFSRMRRTKDYPIPCGMRAAANPVGQVWVKKRFVTNDAISQLRGLTAHDPSPVGMMFKANNGAIFLPSRIADNPSIEVDEYISRLQRKLGAQLAARLANGDWSVVEGAIIDPDHLRYFRLRGGETIVNLTKDRDSLVPVPTQPKDLRRFCTVDTAGTSKQKAAEARGKPSSWSVCGIWDYCSKLKFLHLRHIWRERVGYTDLKDKIAKVIREWSVPVAVIENAHHGQPLAADLKKMVRCRIKMAPTKIKGMKETKGESAKHERAIASGLLGMIQEGRFFLPDIESIPGVSEWLPDFESELMGWTGLPEQTSDQVDICSHAAHHVGIQIAPWGGVIN